MFEVAIDSASDPRRDGSIIGVGCVADLGERVYYKRVLCRGERRCQAAMSVCASPVACAASLATVVRWFGPDDRTGSGNVPVELAAACLLCELAQSKLQPSPLDRHNRGNAAAHHRRTRALRAANANAVAAAHQRNSVRSVSVPAHDASCWRQSASTMRHGCARRPAGKS